MVHLKRGDKVSVKSRNSEIDQALITSVDRIGDVVFGVDLLSRKGGKFSLRFDPTRNGWILYEVEGWTERGPNGTVYELEVLREAKPEPNLVPAHTLVDG